MSFSMLLWAFWFLFSYVLTYFVFMCELGGSRLSLSPSFSLILWILWFLYYMSFLILLSYVCMSEDVNIIYFSRRVYRLNVWVRMGSIFLSPFLPPPPPPHLRNEYEFTQYWLTLFRGGEEREREGGGRDIKQIDIIYEFYEL